MQFAHEWKTERRSKPAGKPSVSSTRDITVRGRINTCPDQDSRSANLPSIFPYITSDWFWMTLVVDGQLKKTKKQTNYITSEFSVITQDKASVVKLCVSTPLPVLGVDRWWSDGQYIVIV